MSNDIDVTGGLGDCEPVPESIKTIDYEELYRKETGQDPVFYRDSGRNTITYTKDFTDFVLNLLALSEARWRDVKTEQVPKDGKEYLLKTNTGIVSGWYSKGEWLHTINGDEYNGACFVCYDDAFTLEIEETENGDYSEVTHWMPLPELQQSAVKEYEDGVR